MSGAEREKDLLNDSATPAGAEVVEVPTTQASAKAKSMKEKLLKKMADLTVVFRKDTRKPLLLGVFLMTMQQLSGIDGVLYVSPPFACSYPPQTDFMYSHGTKLHPVRASSFPRSRPRLLRSHLPRVRRLGDLHFRLHHPGRHLRRPLGSSPIHHLRRPGSIHMHGHHGHALCVEERA